MHDLSVLSVVSEVRNTRLHSHRVHTYIIPIFRLKDMESVIGCSVLEERLHAHKIDFNIVFAVWHLNEFKHGTGGAKGITQGIGHVRRYLGNLDLCELARVHIDIEVIGANDILFNSLGVVSPLCDFGLHSDWVDADQIVIGNLWNCEFAGDWVMSDERRHIVDISSLGVPTGFWEFIKGVRSLRDGILRDEVVNVWLSRARY